MTSAILKEQMLPQLQKDLAFSLTQSFSIYL